MLFYYFFRFFSFFLKVVEICPFFILSYLQVEKILFLSQIFDTKILMDLHVLRSPESENQIFSFGLCICMCVFVISTTQKQITAESSNSAFYICIVWTCYLKLFNKCGKKFCVQGHTKTFLYIKACGWNFLLVNVSILRLHKI